MENHSSKKQKIDNESTTNPFFKLHEDIHPLILQHLSGKDVLRRSRVSSKCYQVISESPAAWKKIQFHFRDISSIRGISSEKSSQSKVTGMLERRSEVSKHQS
jgi:hypothetical protein